MLCFALLCFASLCLALQTLQPNLIFHNQIDKLGKRTKDHLKIIRLSFQDFSFTVLREAFRLKTNGPPPLLGKVLKLGNIQTFCPPPWKFFENLGFFGPWLGHIWPQNASLRWNFQIFLPPPPLSKLSQVNLGKFWIWFDPLPPIGRFSQVLPFF